MVDAEYESAQSFHFLKNNALPTRLKDKIKICPDITAAWAKLNKEFGKVDGVALSMVEAMAMLSFKSSHNHKKF